MCPQYNATGKYGARSEIYSFGVVVLEVLSGRLSGEGGAMLRDLAEDGELLPDTRAGDWPPGLAASLLKLGLDCTGRYNRRPPAMVNVVQMLNAMVREHCPEARAAAGVDPIAQQRLVPKAPVPITAAMLKFSVQHRR
ncbi:hypothetical protein JKP88DRAFT_284986 [Tribonema minus]|uniref:Serine-threonine/tyrosine-protein kinase catalytic domain-containing protein n=1 Tax=Tribonema minus TaxID=303371 RepID=A0A835ZEP8_9STRA|nr:hypothetical protein JKP88DRAFT_284986 [Tribonema minus]